MPNRCVVYGCSNCPNIREGIALHVIPFFGDERPEAKKRRKKWIAFVKTKRAKWEPTQGSSVCSKHFRPEDFARLYSFLPGQESPVIPRLQRDETGVNVCPSVQANIEKEAYLSNRDRRMAKRRFKTAKYFTDTSVGTSHNHLSAPSFTVSAGLSDAASGSYDEEMPEISASSRVECTNQNAEKCHPPKSDAASGSCVEEMPEISASSRVECTNQNAEKCHPPTIDVASGSCDEEMPENTNQEKDIPCTINHKNTANCSEVSTCSNCKWLENDNRKLRNKVVTLRDRLNYRRKEVKRLKRASKVKKSRYHKSTQTSLPGDSQKDHLVEDSKDTDLNPQLHDSDDEYETEEDYDDDEPIYNTETETETESEYTDTAMPELITMKDTDLRTEPKYIIFLSKLLLLFQFCHVCKNDNPLVEVTQVGTEVIVTTSCKNEKCPKKDNIWHSQPTIPGFDVPAGNFLLCMAILLAGGSASKVFQIFAHMGLCCVSLKTFFKHQRTKLFPLIYIYWQKCQEKMLDVVKRIPGGIVTAGDGRHDSMGHCAKYGVYTIFCCTIPMIIHFSLVQRNEAGNSPAMEFMAFQQCMEFLVGCGIIITTFISDRHTSIQRYMRETLPNIKHYFDIWHLKKKIRKVLSKISKVKSCEELKAWIKPCENHLYWSAMSTFDGNGKVIWAKFKSFLSHIINQHKDLDDPLFNKCSHGELEHRTWLDKDSEAYEKLKKALTKNSLQKGIMQASPLSQTSCLEGFHSCLNHFAPKMIHFSYPGMYCRHILAAVHFNNNLRREIQTRGEDGSNRIKVVYPKFKNGEATVRNVRVQQNFGYVDEIYKTFLGLTKDQLKEASQALKDMTPDSMTSALEKETVEDALARKARRSTLLIQDVQPTTPVAQAEQELAAREQSAPSKTRCCTVCKQPMKGHKYVSYCPKNQKT